MKCQCCGHDQSVHAMRMSPKRPCVHCGCPDFTDKDAVVCPMCQRGGFSNMRAHTVPAHFTSKRSWSKGFVRL